MHRKFLVGLAALSLGLGAVGSAQDTGNAPIDSTAAGALDAPEAWNCQQIKSDYGRWLDKGNTPESWKFAGKTYRDVATGKLYSWQDWLDWAGREGCFAGTEETGGGSQTTLLVGGAIGVFGAALIGAQGGSGPKSPG